MTEPGVDPTTRYLERMRLVSNDRFGTKYRPGLANILASSDADTDDLVRIGALVRAFDTQRRVRLMRASGALEATSGEENDLLDMTGAGAEKIQVANYHARASADTDLPWWQDVSNWVVENMYGIDPTDPEQRDTAMSGALTTPGAMITEGALDVLARIPGFLYRTSETLSVSGQVQNALNGTTGERTREMEAQGYTPGNFWDDLAFNWNQGESSFRDLDGLREQYGNGKVDLAVAVFREGTDARNYRVVLENKYAEQWAAGDERGASETQQQIQLLESEDFQEVYDRVDRQHVSIGRDLAHGLLGEDGGNDAAFTAISGTADALWTLFADPTIVGGKVTQSVRLARWGLEGADKAKIFRMLGEELDGVVPTGVYARSPIRAGVQDFIERAGRYREAIARKDFNTAAVEYAGAHAAHKDMMPLWAEVNGIRPAVTEAERAAAKASGIRHVDINGVENAYGAVKVDAITDVRGFAEYFSGHWALGRMANGLPANSRSLMPGRMGSLAGLRAARAMARTKSGLARAGDNSFNFTGDLDRYVYSEADEAFEEAQRAYGAQQFDEATRLRNVGRYLRAKADATSRRLSTLLPTRSELSLHSAADAGNIRRFARMYLPKAEAERFAALWESGSAASRRTLGKALIAQTFEAAGLSRSTVGREFMDQYINDLAELGRRRYGYGDSDLISDTYQGERRAGLYPNQMEDSIVLPSFTELRRIAAKAAVLGYDEGIAAIQNGAKASATTLREAGIGQLARGKLGMTALRYSLFSSTTSTAFMQAAKLGWITTGSNMMRNALDEYGLLTLTGQRGKLGRGRQTMRDADLSATLDEARRFVGVTNHMIPKHLRQYVRGIRDATNAINTGKLEAMGKGAEWRVAYARELHDLTVDSELGHLLGGRLIDNPDELAGLGHEFAQEAARRGVPVTRFKYQGHDLVEMANSDEGLRALAAMYGQRFAGDSPAHGFLAWLMWHYGRANPEFWQSLDKDTIGRMKAALFGDSEAAITLESVEPTVDDLANLLASNRFAALRRESEHFYLDSRGNRIDPNDTAALNDAIRRAIPKYMTDIALSVKAKAGNKGYINPELASRLLAGDIPDVNQLRRLGLSELPSHVVRAQYGVADVTGVNKWLGSYTGLMTRAYDLIVTKPIRSIIRSPLFVDAYTTARHYTQQFADNLVNVHGWDRELADAQARKIAEKQAINDVIKYVDNPQVASQFSSMNRNWWSFFRAQEDWLRRYGRALKADPVAIRKAHLAIIGSEEAGFLDRDEDGNLVLTYPASGAITESFLHLGSYFGWTDPALIPDVPDMTTRLTFLNPSLTNPFAYSATPLVSIPWKIISTVMPGGELMDKQVDRLINGELGAGRSWYEQMLPTPLLRVIQLTPLGGEADNAGSIVGGATATAMINLALNGQLEAWADTPEDRQSAIEKIQASAMNALVVRMLFGFIAPGAPSMPELGEDAAVAQADWTYQQAGIESLNDEFKQMVARMGPGAAYALWTELHPEALVFIEAGKTETSPGARTSVTLGAAGYVMDNRDFFTGRYRAIAPYFMPETPGEFSQVAWNALTELGVRQYKDTEDLFMDIANANGVKSWYEEMDRWDAQIAEARLAGNRTLVAELQAGQEEAKERLRNRYPALDDYFIGGAGRALNRQDMVDRLAELVADPDAPANVQPQLVGLTQMLGVYRNYEAANDELKGQQSKAAQTTRQNLRSNFHDAMRTIIADYPTLEDAYNGIFRSLVEQE